jgi:hypothetical protein
VAHDSEPLAHRGDPRGIVTALLSQPVINVTRLDMDFEEPPDPKKTVQENGGVLATG